MAQPDIFGATARLRNPYAPAPRPSSTSTIARRQAAAGQAWPAHADWIDAPPSPTEPADLRAIKGLRSSAWPSSSPTALTEDDITGLSHHQPSDEETMSDCEWPSAGKAAWTQPMLSSREWAERASQAKASARIGLCTHQTRLTVPGSAVAALAAGGADGRATAPPQKESVFDRLLNRAPPQPASAAANGAASRRGDISASTPRTGAGEGRRVRDDAASGSGGPEAMRGGGRRVQRMLLAAAEANEETEGDGATPHAAEVAATAEVAALRRALTVARQQEERTQAQMQQQQARADALEGERRELVCFPTISCAHAHTHAHERCRAHCGCLCDALLHHPHLTRCRGARRSSRLR